jgi:N-acetylmuramoyl-L-alanine amidase
VKLRDYKACSTNALAALDRQLIAEINDLSPGALVNISKMPGLILADGAAHPWLTPKAAVALERAIKSAGKKLTANSLYRTLAQQHALYQNQKVCGIVAAPTGKSNHQSGSAIDIEDPYGWKLFLEAQGWKKLGDWDRMHYDFPGEDIKHLSIVALQRLCKRNGISIATDGDLGPATMAQLLEAPIEGFEIALTPRILRLTTPNQQGNDVIALQRKLGLKADGVFGLGTDAAVKSWQLAQGLATDGVVGRQSRAAIGIA